MVALEVSVLLKVDVEPGCLRGWLLRFSPNLPPEREDSAARESDATAPAPSVVEFVYRSGSEVTCDVVQIKASR